MVNITPVKHQIVRIVSVTESKKVLRFRNSPVYNGNRPIFLGFHFSHHDYTAWTLIIQSCTT